MHSCLAFKLCKHLNATSEALSVFPLHDKDYFIDTDFICLVSAQMSYYNSLIKCKNFKRQHTFRKNGFIKVKMPIPHRI